MKKLLCLFCLLALICGALVGCAAQVKNFDVSEYQYEIERFSSEKNVGSIANSKDAIQKAEVVWIEIYGEDVEEEQPYQASYDDQNDVWLVEGTLKGLRHKGGVAKILIEGQSGDVLAVWHEE